MRRTLILPSLVATMTEFEISATTRRAAAFLAQIAHETESLLYLQEIASGEAYNGRADLGNTQPGDGPRFKGRGLLQLTGRANYAKYGELLGVNLISNPGAAAQPPLCSRVAGLYWHLHGCNALMDAGNFLGTTKAINGGENGQTDREAFYHRALQVLGA